MAKNTGMAGKLVIITAMVLFMFMATVVESGKHVDKECYYKCYARHCRGKYAAMCGLACLRKCTVHDSEAIDNCTFSCANSKCDNFSSDEVGDVEGCVYSCAENCESKS
ncbi:hypothetical protein Dsin_013680 [Dipteronia sinensis]|uniref:Thionin-like protein n=1 Tax=Dipteronia sinensis TaxID=43782 RepID=A0AAE0AL64_9ROSI|nr:hypothetical protein Dsin_013680 [Dipteronia sinensis]